MHKLDREGIFKLKPLRWNIRESDNSKSLAVNIEFMVLAQLDGEDWLSWEEYEDHAIWGAFYVVKRDGSINGNAVDQLVDALDWDGDLRSVAGEVPDVIVQGTVKAETYKGVTRHKVTWLNPEDYVPSGGGVDEDLVRSKQSEFGSLLKAAARARKEETSKAKKASGKKKAPPKKSPPKEKETYINPEDPFDLGDEDYHREREPGEEG